jgi:uncharacterized membrane protein (UPF0127 family)
MIYSMKKYTKRLIKKYKKSLSKILIGVFFVVILFGGYSVYHFFVEKHEVSKIADRMTRTIFLNGRPYTVVVSHTDALRQQGLSGTRTVPHDGMLFVFPEEEFAGFWMQDMNYAIDIVWMDSDSQIVDITREVSPKTYPKVFYPKEPVKYVLEFPEGFAEAIGLQINSRIDLGSEIVAQ